MTSRNVFTTTTIVVIVALLILVLGLHSKSNQYARTIVSLQDSLATLRADVDTLRGEAPGLGEYMTTFQLHMAKLWFAAHASNWGLAQYELGELAETMGAAEALHAVKNNVNTAGVIESVRGTQVVALEKSIADRNESSFVHTYSQTVETCNSCHRAVGYGFIFITQPASPPVFNQRWKPRK
jgi:hypothetical protein